MNTASCALMALVLLTLSACLGCPKAPTPYQLEQETVALVNEDTGGIYCSGTWISESRVLTAAHCMAGDKIGDRVVFRDRDSEDHVGYWSSSVDEVVDLAIIEAWHPVSHHRFAPVAKRYPRDGDVVQIAGHPLAMGWSYMTTIVSSQRMAEYDDNPRRVHVLQLQGPLCRGQSGSAIFNDDGEIVGVFVRMRETSFMSNCGFGFAVHLDEVQAFLSANPPPP